MRNLLVLAALSSLMISCATVKSWMGSSEPPASQQQPKEPDPLDLSGTESAASVTPAKSEAAVASTNGEESSEKASSQGEGGPALIGHDDPYVAEAATEIQSDANASQNSVANDSSHLPQKTVNEEMAGSTTGWHGEPTPAIANVAPEEPRVYDTSLPPKKGKKGVVASSKKPALKGKAVAKKPKVDCKKVAKLGKKAKKPDVAYCKAEKKALAKAAAAKKTKVDCKKVAKLGKKAKKPDVAYCKAEAKKKAAKNRVASKGY